MILIIYAIYSLNFLYLLKLEDCKNILLCFCSIKVENFAFLPRRYSGIEFEMDFENLRRTPGTKTPSIIYFYF